MPTVALVGYTNAGKTTLFNALTGDDAVASDALFVTLDPLVRRVRCRTAASCSCRTRSASSIACRTRSSRRSARRSRKSPEADLLLHVIDAAASRARTPDRRGAMRAGGGRRRSRAVLEVYNKCDLLDAGERARLSRRHPGALLRFGAQRATAATS